MEFSENFESFGHFNNDPLCNLLDEEIPQNIFDELMNDVNYQALGLDMNSVSSEDSGRSSSSYDDFGIKMDTFADQAMLELPLLPPGNIKCETIDDDPNSPMSYICTTASPAACTINATPSLAAVAATTAATSAGNTQSSDRIDRLIEISRPKLTTQPTISQIQQQQQQDQQPKYILSSQPHKIVVKQEPIKFHTQTNVQPQQHQTIFTLQSIGGQQFVVTNANQTPVNTIVNGTAGIVVPIIQQQPILATPKKSTLASATMSTIKLQPTRVAMKSNTLPVIEASATTVAMKPSKKSGHNIIERRYRTSIVNAFFPLKIIIRLF